MADAQALARAWRDRSLSPGRSPVLERRFTAGTEALVEQVLGPMDPEATCLALEEIVRVRAVQGLPPSQALAFVFDLRPILEEAGLEEPGRRVDQVALFAFDLYSRAREEVLLLRFSGRIP